MPFPSRIEGKKEGKRAALDAERAQRAARKRKRDEGIAMLKEHNIFVDSLPGEYWRGFKDLHLDSFEGFPQTALEHLPSKMLNSLTCTDSLADLFKKKGGLFAPSRP